ncbi:MAG: hypothetical protein M0Q90_07990 [Bacteroidales bacterium]|nr:hypothetical protein [Bacteroidales bacterium]
MFVLLLTIGLSACQSVPTENNSSEEIETSKIPVKHEVAGQFINAYADFCYDRTAEIGILNWVKGQENVSADFKTELEKIIVEAETQNPDYGLEFDPIFEAQDFPDVFVIDSYDGNFVTLRGKKLPDFKLVMKVVEVNGSWLVDGSGVVNIPEEKRVKRF